MNAVVEQLPTVVDSIPPATTMLQVIERAALNPQVDIDKMERLLAMKERMDLKEAEAAFNEAMTKCQSEMGRISTDAENSQTHSKYATYGKLDRELRPLYVRHGFSLSFSTADSPLPACIRVTCTVARGGFSRQYQIDMPNDGKGAKGNDVMTRTHATGAAAQYGMRYLLKMIFNVAIGEDDQDGNTERVNPKDHGEQLTDKQIGYVNEFVVAFRNALNADVDEELKAQQILALRAECSEDPAVFTETWGAFTAPERRALKEYVKQAEKANK